MARALQSLSLRHEAPMRCFDGLGAGGQEARRHAQAGNTVEFAAAAATAANGGEESLPLFNRRPIWPTGHEIVIMARVRRRFPSGCAQAYPQQRWITWGLTENRPRVLGPSHPDR
ncbi:hypothetical protein CKO40_23125 [Halochromatium glycolicum]|jgi:hypothetical protein|uniref:Uncharacterized protein n=1 Tax=Halochromatium glycolicum TaxID=85075 RepID=A0AAJ0XBV3_9GAMM|nr:hypothetical protein [Halochromatium glycolicum]